MPPALGLLSEPRGIDTHMKPYSANVPRPVRASALGILTLSLLGSLSLSLSATAASNPVGIILGPSVTPHAEVAPGEILLRELNCTTCHAPDSATQRRLISRPAPNLSQVGNRVTPQHLRSFLTSPQETKPGTPMPDLLHGLEGSQKTETVNALVYYLSSLRTTNASAAAGSSPHLVEQGKRLYHSVGCVACHAPQDTMEPLTAETVAALAKQSVPLGPLARKTDVDSLATFLMDPLKARPSGRMPSLNLTRGEAIAIATYLLREQATAGSKGPSVKMPGLHYEYFETVMRSVSGIDSATPVGSGTVDTFTLSPKKRNEGMAFRFTGLLQVGRSNSYTFFVASDDGSRLWIDGTLVVDNDGVHGTTEKSGKIVLRPGEHTIALAYFNEYAGGELNVAWQEEGRNKRPIPPPLLTHVGQSMQPLDPEVLSPNPELVARGHALFGSLGCASCHALEGKGLAPAVSAPALASLNAGSATGCLGTPKPGSPRFALSDAQRESIRSALKSGTLSQPPSPKLQLAHEMTALNCFACHNRENAGGPAEGRSDLFITVDHADLGDEGRIPPHLNKAGDKLRTEWLTRVLLKRGAVRPYMATRMPQFGEAAVGHLPALFEKADASPARPLPASNPQDAKFGRQLVGTTGVSCIACHTFAGHKSLGVPALDLTTVPDRLKHDWFVRYLPDPAALRPGTRMPSFWPNGKAANRDILGGDSTRQIEAIWTYLSAGKAAKIPEGLVPVGVELVASKEAVIYRHFIEGAGSRGIGVGYPEKANIAWDANQLRLAEIWHGKFIDAGKHRRDRGTGYESPLGDDVVKLPEGAPFATLASMASPWPEASGKIAGYQMRGYRLDAVQRPTFLFSMGSVDVEDQTIALAHEPEPVLKRTLSLKSKEPFHGLWFRAAVADKIEAKPDGSYLVDGRLVLRFQLTGAGKPVVRKSQGKSELIIPLQSGGTDVRIVEDIAW